MSGQNFLFCLAYGQPLGKCCETEFSREKLVAILTGSVALRPAGSHFLSQGIKMDVENENLQTHPPGMMYCSQEGNQ